MKQQQRTGRFNWMIDIKPETLARLDSDSRILERGHYLGEQVASWITKVIQDGRTYKIEARTELRILVHPDEAEIGEFVDPDQFPLPFSKKEAGLEAQWISKKGFIKRRSGMWERTE